MKVKGYAAQSTDSDLAGWEFERRTPGNKDVSVQIEHCGICHSAIHFARNERGSTSYPCVPGHEIIGRVVEVGSDVSRHSEGDLVGVGCFVHSCRTCGSCHDDLENYCENGVRPLRVGAIPATSWWTNTSFSRSRRTWIRPPQRLFFARASPLIHHCATSG